MPKTFDFVGEEVENLFRKYTPTLVGMGAGAGLISAVRAGLNASGEQNISLVQNLAIDGGLFLGAAWASQEFTRGMTGKATQGLVLAGSVSVVNDIWQQVSPSGEGLQSYVASLFEGATTSA